MLSRFAVSLASGVASAVAVLSPAPAAGAPLPVEGDHLTVTVVDSGDPGFEGTYELFCHPAGGDHPDADEACARLDELTVWGSPSPFAPVPKDAMCTMQYGGPATAHVEGTWAGRPVNADLGRDNGCEISRWDNLVPLLPVTRS